MKSALITASFREIRNTFSRFLSIFLIVALGTGFFAGVKATSPDMLRSIDGYFDETRLADLRLVSTLGFDEADVAAVRAAAGNEAVMPSYTADMLCAEGDRQLVVRLHSLAPEQDGKDALNRPVLLEGRMPENETECLAEASGFLQGGFLVGDEITVFSGTDDPAEDTLSVTAFTVTGLIRSPWYISFERGTSSIGSGSVDRFIYVPQQAFSLEVYTDVYVAAEGAAQKQSYSSAYDDLVQAHKNRMQQVADLRQRQRYDGIVADAEKELADGEKKLADAQREADEKLADAERELADARQTLADGYAAYYDGKKTFTDEIEAARQTLADGRAKLADGRSQYRSGLAAYEEKSASAHEELADAQKAIDEGLARYRQGLAAYEQGVRTHAALTELFAAASSPDTPAEQRQAALAHLGELAQQLAQAEQTQDLGQLLAAYTQAPDNPELAGGAQAAISAFEQALEQSKQELDGAHEELRAGQGKISAGYSALFEASAQLQSAKQQLEDAQKELQKGEETLAKEQADGEKKLADAWAELVDGEKKLADGELEYSDAKAKADKELADARQTIADGRKELDELSPPKWYLFTRDSIPGNAGYYDDAQRINAISGVFPVFFFLIAALVCLTTMTRMVEEKRTELGTIKALGYGKGAAVFKFLFYAGTASLLGSAAGLAVGLRVLPYIIGSAYGIMYRVPEIQTPFLWSYALPITLVAVLGTMLAALLACYKELAEQPASLMRPKAPKPGKRVLLERVGPVWRRLGFIQKVTLRNLLRYKRRMLMTVIGIAGCTALMLAGFGLKNSIYSIAVKQYDEIFLYNGMVLLDEDAPDRDKEQLSRLLDDGQSTISGTLRARQETVTALEPRDGREFEAALFVPKTTQNISDYAVLRTRDAHTPIPLTQDGAVITEKLATLLGVASGDVITVRDIDNQSYEIPVAAVTENYAFHYIYLAAPQYERIFGRPFEANTAFLRLSDTSEQAQDALSEELIANGAVVSVTYNTSVAKSFHDTVDSLNYVVLVLIVCAGLLAFVVLYNLTNINVTERLREIATIKVLGFFDGEVSSYIYRENVLLTLMGIGLGLFGGIFLHRFVIQTAEIDAVMFGREIGWFGFVMSALLTALFALLVNLSLHFRLKRVSMVESLKSVE